MGRRKRYSAEFKRQVLRRANEPGVTDAVVCEELGVSTRQLRRWRDTIQEHGEPTSQGRKQRQISSITSSGFITANAATVIWTISVPYSTKTGL